MSMTRVSPNTQRPAVPRQEQKDREEKAAFDKAQEAQGVPRESFISSVVSARQPPRLALGAIEQAVSNSDATLFRAEIDNLAKRPETALAADVAEIYLAFSGEAHAEGDPELIAAFEYLGETMLNYEHLRLLRTGQLG